MDHQLFLKTFFHGLQAGLSGLQTVREAYDERMAFGFSAVRFFQPGENKTSEILAFFLDPTKPHGQKTAFLKAFLRKFDLTEALRLMEMTMPKVETETRTDAGRRIDITIRFNSEYIIGIENKIWAVDQPNQLSDYHKWMKAESRDRFVLFYLSPHGRPASSYSISANVAADLTSSTKLRSISYVKHVIELFAEFETICVADNVRAFIRDFVQYLKQEYRGEKIMAEQEFLTKFIRDNPQVLKLVDGISQARTSIRESYYDPFWKALIEALHMKGLEWRVSKEPEGHCRWASFLGNPSLHMRICYEMNTPFRMYLGIGKVASALQGAGKLRAFENKMRQLGYGENRGWVRATIDLSSPFSDDAICEMLRAQDADLLLRERVDGVVRIALDYAQAAETALRELPNPEAATSQTGPS